MNEQVYYQLTALASEPDAQRRAVEYLASQLGQFLKKRDKVLILFPDTADTVGSLLREAVIRCGGVPRFLGEDQRWITILKTAFVTKSDCIIGSPLTILGLAKVAKHMGTPLFARNIVCAGYPIKQWMVDGIERGLDCKAWGCYDPGYSTMVAGFTCRHCRLHLRADRYHARIRDEAGTDLPEGSFGRVVLSPLCHDELQFDTGDLARLDTAICECGSHAPRLMDIDTNNDMDPMLSDLGEQMQHWSSILDCKLTNTGCGLELEVVVFPGEKLPKLPSCAKLTIRPWDPEIDEPFPHAYVLKRRLFSRETH